MHDKMLGSSPDSSCSLQLVSAVQKCSFLPLDILKEQRMKGQIPCEDSVMNASVKAYKKYRHMLQVDGMGVTSQ